MTDETKPLSAEEILVIKERCEKAAPGPWFTCVPHKEEDMAAGLTGVEDGRYDGLFPILAEAFEAAFIAHARIDLPRALKTIEAKDATIRAQADRIAICRGTFKGKLDGRPVSGTIHDGTDAACPGWWRGHDYTAEKFKEKVETLEVNLAAQAAEIEALKSERDSFRGKLATIFNRAAHYKPRNSENSNEFWLRVIGAELTRNYNKSTAQAEEIDRLREAGEWVLHIINGIGKSGGEPQEDEAEAAFEALKAALQGAEEATYLSNVKAWAPDVNKALETLGDEHYLPCGNGGLTDDGEICDCKAGQGSKGVEILNRAIAENHTISGDADEVAPVLFPAVKKTQEGTGEGK